MTSDTTWMQKALVLAKEGRWHASPNPYVGAIVVSDNQLVGQGAHQKFGQAHAEVHALLQAGEKAKGATLYVTLEPCAHTGKTPPCVDAIIQAGIRRVVIAMTDPNAQAAGGVAALTAAGVVCEVGVCEAEAQHLNRGFISRVKTGKPWVCAKMAMSTDGSVAMASGESQWITGEPARRAVQEHRSHADAILTGVGTVLADNPAMTVRLPEYTGKQPVRVVMDTQARLPLSARICQQPGKLVWLTGCPVLQTLPSNVMHYQLPVQGDKLDWEACLGLLGELSINMLWIEAGPKLFGSAIEAGILDEVIFYMAPKFLGGDAKSLAHLPSQLELPESNAFTWNSVRLVGQDVELCGLWKK